MTMSWISWSLRNLDRLGEAARPHRLRFAVATEPPREAKLVEKAVSYFLKAGQGALQRSAMAEAAAHLRKGLEVLSQAQIWLTL
jgi:predicted ATPase